MAIDPVSRRAFGTPMFMAGALLLVVGLIPVGVALLSGWNGISGTSFLTVFAPIGAILMAIARSTASRQGR
jgi:hypothetical protein